jgi:L-lactate dehydrogenase complex protein LldG
LSAHGQNDDVRRDILAAIRRHLTASAPFDAVRAEHHAHESGTHAQLAPAATAHAQVAAPVARFHDALAAVGGHCIVVNDDRAAADVVRQLIEQKQAQRIAVSDAPLVQKVCAQVQADAVLFAQTEPPALFDCDIGITSAQWAVAETGTLILESDRERHRLSSLVPPVHVAIIEAAQVRQTLGEVLQAMGEQGQAGLSRTVTFITGPSRTSDIELTLAIGVHGPGELYVIIIAGEGHD